MTAQSASIEPRRLPTQARSRARVERILEAARELVASLPVEKVTTNAIAEAADLPIGSLYQYFPNRLAILAEVARRNLREIDEATVAFIRSTHGLPWREAVDAVVDAHVAAFRDENRALPLASAIVPTPEFAKLDAESNARIAEALAAHPALAACGAARERIARCAIEAAGAVQAWALAAEDPAESLAIAEEMKRLLKAYLALHIEGDVLDPGGAI